MKFSFHAEAEIELHVAIDYYEAIEQGLGYEFSMEVYAEIQRVVEFPFAWTELDTDIRRSLVHRFPYGVLYTVEKAEIYILAVMNLHQKPNYWKTRKEISNKEGI